MLPIRLQLLSGQAQTQVDWLCPPLLGWFPKRCSIWLARLTCENNNFYCRCSLESPEFPGHHGLLDYFDGQIAMFVGNLGMGLHLPSASQWKSVGNSKKTVMHIHRVCLRWKNTFTFVKLYVPWSNHCLYVSSAGRGWLFARVCSGVPVRMVTRIVVRYRITVSVAIPLVSQKSRFEQGLHRKHHITLIPSKHHVELNHRQIAMKPACLLLII